MESEKPKREITCILWELTIALKSGVTYEN